MIHPALDLQSRVYETLTANQDLTTILGGPQIFDDVPGNSKPPYITFGNAAHFDWSTGTETGMEHLLSIEVWSKVDGRKEVLEIAQTAEDALATMSPQLQESYLINFRHESTEVERNVKTGLFRARINYRAVTEPN